MCQHIVRLLILTIVIKLVQANCSKSDKKPEVTVRNSTHIHVSWKNSFEDCGNEKVLTSYVEVYPFNTDKYVPIWKDINFSDGSASVKVSPCLKHQIREAIPKFVFYRAGI